MIRPIAVTARKNRLRNRATFDAIGLPKIRLTSRERLDDFYRTEGLGCYRDCTATKVSSQKEP